MKVTRTLCIIFATPFESITIGEKKVKKSLRDASDIDSS